MTDPVVAADGHTYERRAIAMWLQRSDKSPLTNQKLPTKALVPNHMVKSAIKEWVYMRRAAGLEVPEMEEAEAEGDGCGGTSPGRAARAAALLRSGDAEQAARGAGMAEELAGSGEEGVALLMAQDGMLEALLGAAGRGPRAAAAGL